MKEKHNRKIIKHLEIKLNLKKKAKKKSQRKHKDTQN